VTVRSQKGDDLGGFSIDAFVQQLKQEIQHRK